MTAVARPQRPLCAVPPDALDAAPPCPSPAPIDGFHLVEKWRYSVPTADFWTLVNAPLVANLTDDNSDGVIDLCDTPDVLVQVYINLADDSERSLLYMLSGSDGHVEAILDPADAGHPTRALTLASPAIFDLDADGVPEILVTNEAGHVMALDPSGGVVWESPVEVFDAAGLYGPNGGTIAGSEADELREEYVWFSAVTVADLDGDGSPEILVGMTVLDGHGNLPPDATQGTEYGRPNYAPSIRPIAADLDGDGSKEVIFGHVGYHADGSELYRLPLTTTPGFAEVADFFADGQLEVLIESQQGPRPLCRPPVRSSGDRSVRRTRQGAGA